MDALLPARRRGLADGPAGRRDAAARLGPSTRATRCRPSAARISSGEPVMRGGAFDQREAPRRVRRTRPPSCRCQPPRRAGLPDADRSTEDLEIVGPVDGAAVDRLRRARHRFHRQADRRLSAERGLPAGLRDEPDRGHAALPLPRQLGAARRRSSPARSTAITIELFPTANLFAPATASRLDIASQQLPAFRREPEYRRARRSLADMRARAKHAVRRREPAVACRAAGPALRRYCSLRVCAV